MQERSTSLPVNAGGLASNASDPCKCRRKIAPCDLSHLRPVAVGGLGRAFTCGAQLEAQTHMMDLHLCHRCRRPAPAPLAPHHSFAMAAQAHAVTWGLCTCCALQNTCAQHPPHLLVIGGVQHDVGLHDLSLVPAVALAPVIAQRIGQDGAVLRVPMTPINKGDGAGSAPAVCTQTGGACAARATQ